MKHLCHTCSRRFDYPHRCGGHKLKFSIDVDPTLQGEQADRIIECNGYRLDLRFKQTEGGGE